MPKVINIKNVEFLTSKESVETCPDITLPEYAFIGRSNVGKSTLINFLAGRKELARVSKTPGKTQLINYFMVNEEWNLVDLPGYGYAQISRKSRKKWLIMINDYLEKREQLMTTFILLDGRIDLQKIDLDFINSLGEKGIPFSIVMTKIDGVKRRLREATVARFEAELGKYWNELPPLFLTSSVEKLGREEILSYIEELNHFF